MQEQIDALARRILEQKNKVQTEEATKTSFILPFLQILGYDFFNPSEVVPEFTSDVGTKKGEKVDYAIFLNGEPTILIEAKPCGIDLNSVTVSQLYRYFSVHPARIGILTNGVQYRFFSDLDKSNIMDDTPFFELNLLNYNENALKELEKFTKQAFSIENIISSASELKYIGAAKRLLAEEFQNPSDDFLRFFTAKLYPGRATQQVREQFFEVVKKAFNQFVSEKVSTRLKSAEAAEKQANTPPEMPQEAIEQETFETQEENKIVTTPEEITGHAFIKAILREEIDANRITMRDTINYCGILLDDTNRKPICRLYFNNLKNLRIGIFLSPKEETKFSLESVNDLFFYADEFKKAIKSYE